MKTLRAVFAGVLGALAMSLAMFLLRVGGINVNLEALLGTLLEAPAGFNSWIAGFALHLVIGGFVGLVYAFVFEVAVQRSGLLVGMGLGLCHGLLAGLMMSGIPAMNPLTADGNATGPFLRNVAFGPFIFILLHCLYGAVTGIAYGRPLQHPHYYNRGAV